MPSGQLLITAFTGSNVRGAAATGGLVAAGVGERAMRLAGVCVALLLCSGLVYGYVRNKVVGRHGTDAHGAGRKEEEEENGEGEDGSGERTGTGW